MGGRTEFFFCTDGRMEGHTEVHIEVVPPKKKKLKKKKNNNKKKKRSILQDVNVGKGVMSAVKL